MPKQLQTHLRLTNLSHQHKSVLLFCWKIRQGVNKDIAFGRIGHYIRFYWEKFLKVHFHEEESFLFMAAPGEVCSKAIDQHIAIEHSINAVTSSLTDHAESFQKLADLVEQHVKYEELELFPQLERQLGADVLCKVETALKEAEIAIDNETYGDEFWLKI